MYWHGIESNPEVLFRRISLSATYQNLCKTRVQNKQEECLVVIWNICLPSQDTVIALILLFYLWSYPYNWLHSAFQNIINAYWSCFPSFWNVSLINFRTVHMRIQDNVVAVMTKLWDGQLRIHGLIPRRSERFFSCPKQPGASAAFCLTGSGGLSPREKRLGHAADHSSPSRSEVKNVWSSVSTPSYAFMVWTGATLTLLSIWHVMLLCVYSFSFQIWSIGLYRT